MLILTMGKAGQVYLNSVLSYIGVIKSALQATDKEKDYKKR